MLAVSCGMLSGCSIFNAFTPKPDPSKFFVLSPIPASQGNTTPADANVAIGVFNPQIPAYLDRPQIITRDGTNQVSMNEFERWAEPVDAGIARVMAQDMAVLTGSSQIAQFPGIRMFNQEFEVYVLVMQFDGMPGGDVHLRARWRITGLGGKPNYYTKDTSLTDKATLMPNPYAGYVQALSDLVGQLSQEVTAALPDARAAEAKAIADEKAAATDTKPATP